MPPEKRDALVESGDTHNFGRHTIKVLDNGKVFFKKHRNLFWEWLLLDKTSPLCAHISTFMPTSFTNTTFGLKVQLPLGENIGFVEGIKGATELSEVFRSEEVYFNVGLQLAYYSSLGIIDLLLENFKVIPQGLQLIDAECIFHCTSRLEDASILPFKGNQFDGKFALFPYFYNLQERHLLNSLTSGFIKGLFLFEQHKEGIIHIINKEIDRSPPVPIRVLLRSTIEYDLYLTENRQPKISFVHEELVQLARGDIPYFFKFLGMNEVFYYNSEQFDKAAVSPKSLSIKPNFNQMACPVVEVMDNLRLLFSLLRNGTASLCRWSSIGTKQEVDYQDESIKIRISGNNVHIIYLEQEPVTFPI